MGDFSQACERENLKLTGVEKTRIRIWGLAESWSCSTGTTVSFVVAWSNVIVILIVSSLSKKRGHFFVKQLFRVLSINLLRYWKKRTSNSFFNKMPFVFNNFS